MGLPSGLQQLTFGRAFQPKLGQREFAGSASRPHSAYWEVSACTSVKVAGQVLDAQCMV